MRTLVLMRGCPGSGKSTVIKEAGLEQYALSSDDYRLKVSAPYLNEDGDFYISQNFDHIAWAGLYRDLEERFKHGHFTIIDACNASVTQCNRYMVIADKYGYSAFVYNVNVPLDVALERNKNREEYKRVPEKPVRRIHALVETVKLSNSFKPISSFDEVLNFYTVDITSRYDQVAILGDIHGCYTALQDTLKLYGGIENEKTLFIFLGDYNDRGIQEKETLDWLLENYTRPNLVLLQGNHDTYLRMWSHNADKSELPRFFLKYTLPQYFKELNEKRDAFLLTNPSEEERIAYFEEHNAQIDALKSKVRRLTRKYRQAYAFTFHGQKYLCTHGGLSSVPPMTLIPTHQLIKGTGGYETNLGEIYDANYLAGKCQGFIQFHGHRDVPSGLYSTSLEGGVEDGGVLKSVLITHDTTKGENVVMHNQIQNEVYRIFESTPSGEEEAVELEYVFPNKELTAIVNSGYTKVKRQEAPYKDIISVSFVESVFKKNIWNDITIQARGLFIEEETGDVIARGYNKTFNYGQTKANGKRALENNLKFPVIAYEKYNGFLGLMSWYKDELFISSKNMATGPFKEMFKSLWDKEDPEFKARVEALLKRENATILFEVIHNDDKHIVDYHDKEFLVILDVVPNDIEVSVKHPGVYKHVDTEYSNAILSEIREFVGQANHTSVKKEVAVFNDMDSIQTYMNWLDKQPNLEGAMFVDQVGYVFKYKAKIYSDWKRRRGLRYLVRRYRGNAFPMQYCSDVTDIAFMNWLFKQPDEVVYPEKGEGYSTNFNSIVELRRLFETSIRS